MKVWKSMKKEDQSVPKKIYDEFLAKSKDLDENYLSKRQALEKEFSQHVKAKVKKEKKPKKEAPATVSVATGSVTPSTIVKGSDGLLVYDLSSDKAVKT
jgi:hypothetical protein